MSDNDLQITGTLSVPASALTEEFVRASGPGGQNVNKVATAVQLRCDITQLAWLDSSARERLRRLAGYRMTSAGVLVIEAKRFRTQIQNREDAEQRLAELVRSALVPPKKRRVTRPSRAAKQRRLDGKKQRGQVKKGRGRVTGF